MLPVFPALLSLRSLVDPHVDECFSPLSLVGRTVTNSNGEARVALDYFQSIGATHVGVLFVTVSNANRLYLY